ncbi:MAG: nucleotide disphospho-sugar-binding domain-containing protein [Pseudomonadota bacterium]
MSYRVLLATFGSLGDLHPFMAIGRALRERGIEARLAAAPDYREMIEAAGLEFAPMRPSLGQFGDREALSRRLFQQLRGAEIMMRELVIPFVREAHEDVSRAAVGTDLFVSHTLTFALHMLAEHQRKPWLSVALAPIAFMSRNDPPILPGFDLLRIGRRFGPRGYDWALALMHSVIRRWERPLHEFRAQIGLPATRHVHMAEGQFSPQGTLAMFDGVLTTPQPDWPPNVMFCGAPVYDGAAPDPLRLIELQQFLARGAPPLVFALGSSAIYIAKDFWQQALAASRRLGRRAILITGKPVALPSGDDYRAFDYLPYSAVFPHAAAVVHQVGIGTLSQAMRSGRPQLLVPVSFDQPDNAHRAAKLGIARVLPFQRVNAARLESELRALLADANAAAAARKLATTLHGTDGAGNAAEFIAAKLEAGARRG